MHICAVTGKSRQNQKHEMLFYQTLRTYSSTVPSTIVSAPTGKMTVKHGL